MKMLRVIVSLVVIHFIAMYSAGAYALAFNIFPKAGTTLPTTIPAGQTALAFYTVANNTSGTRVGNFVKYTQPNTQQNTTDTTYPDTCQQTFTLAPKGMPGDSCTLVLTITGAVTSCNCNQHECLFVCATKGATCAGTQYPLNVTEIPVPPPAKTLTVTVGLYDRFFGAPPPFHQPPVFEKPLAYISPDKGLSWTNVSVPLLGTGDAELASVSCSTPPHCVTVGFYTSGGLQPSAFVSNDEGQTWTTALPPSPGGQARLAGVSCNGNNCAAVGNLFVNPLGFYSTNGGSTWTQSPMQAPAVFENLMTGVSCSASNACVAVGTYQASPSLLSRRPLTYASSNGGQTWSAPIFPTPIMSSLHELNAVFCSGTNCLAAGSYENGASEFPLMYRSTDNGTTWTPITIPPHAGSSRSVLLGVHCDGSHCITVGFWFNPISPLAYISSDGGVTWTESMVSNFAFGALLTSVFCQGSICNAGGYFDNNGFADTRAVSYRSTDYGATWSSPIQPPYIGEGGSQLNGFN